MRSLACADTGAPTAESILPCVDRALRDAGVGLSEVSVFALAIGPGSFTGLRVGLATVKGLAFAQPRPVAAVPTLLALALAAGSDRTPVAALLDARRGEVYAAAFAPGDGRSGDESLVPEGLYTPLALMSLLPPGCAFAGDGATLHASEFLAAGFAEARWIFEEPSGVAVGRLGAHLYARGAVHAAAVVVPHYLRRAEAEARRTGEPREAQKLF